MVLPGPEVILAQPRDIEYRLIGAEYARKQPCLFLALLQDASYGNSIVLHLRLALHIKGIIGVHSDLFQDNPQRRRLKLAAVGKGEDLLVVDLNSRLLHPYYRGQRLWCHLIGMHEMSHQAEVSPSKLLVAAQDLAELFGEPLGDSSWRPAGHSYALQVRDLGEPVQDPVDQRVIHHQGVSTG